MNKRLKIDMEIKACYHCLYYNTQYSEWEDCCNHPEVAGRKIDLFPFPTWGCPLSDVESKKVE